MKPTWEWTWNPLTSGLTPLVVDVQGATLVHTGDNLVLSAVEAVHSNHTGLLLGVGIVRVGGVQVVLKHGQAVQVLNLGGQAGLVSETKGVLSWPSRPAASAHSLPSTLPSPPSGFI